MLKQSALSRLLISEGTISPMQVVEGSLKITEASHRNLNFSVISETGPSYLVKQAIGDERRASVELEAEVYELLQRDDRYKALLSHMFPPLGIARYQSLLNHSLTSARG